MAPHLHRNWHNIDFDDRRQVADIILSQGVGLWRRTSTVISTSEYISAQYNNRLR